MLFRGHPVALLYWLVDVQPAAIVRDRIVAALNGEVPPPPAVLWHAQLSSPHRWDLHFEGRLVGEFAWVHPPAGDHEQTGPARVLDALNDVPANAVLPTPARGRVA